MFLQCVLSCVHQYLYCVLFRFYLYLQWRCILIYFPKPWWKSKLWATSCPCLPPRPPASSENDRDFKFCGIWRHGNNPLSVNYDLSPGCEGISISANETSLSVKGQITVQCEQQSEVILLNQFEHRSAGQSHFCLYWEPLFDQLLLEVSQKEKDARSAFVLQSIHPYV